MLVSIRAPIRRPGRPLEARAVAAEARFQSAPRSEDRGDRDRTRHRARQATFQSAPRSEDRGDSRTPARTSSPTCFNPRPDPKTGATCPHERPRRCHQVSIRAPIRRPGRLSGFTRTPRTSSFQSAPRSEDRGDARALANSGSRSGFNPRPDPKTGATSGSLRIHPRGSSFNPRPDPKTGATRVGPRRDGH